MGGRKTKKLPGFTIVELLIVIVVIGILASLVVTAYSGVQQRARITAAKADLQALAKATEVYRADSGNYPVQNTAWKQIFENANLYDSTRVASQKSFMVCVRDGVYAIVAASPTGSKEVADGLWYYVSSETGMTELAYDTAATGTYTIDRVCQQTPAYPVTYLVWSNQL